MNYKTTLLSIALMVAISGLLFRYYESRLSDLFLSLAVHPEIEAALEAAAEDKKRLSRLDPEQQSRYRSEFEDLRNISNNLRILRQNKDALKAHFQWAIWLLFATIMIAAAGVHVLMTRRTNQRLTDLQEPLSRLAEGNVGIRVNDISRDSIGRIGRMIEKTSDLIAGQREQLHYLKHLSSWQEAARRHAHEINTPLAAARMEVETLLEMEAPEPERIQQSGQSIIYELDQLKRFTREFTSFARIPKPQLEVVSLGDFVREFCRLFAKGWEGLRLEVTEVSGDLRVMIDRDMIRQVLVNLCNNAALARTAETLTCRLRAFRIEQQIQLEVADDGPGIDSKVVVNLFEPYTTTRSVGEGMGLGLAISRKIMLDHGGDLVLVNPNGPGAVFALRFDGGVV